MYLKSLFSMLSTFLPYGGSRKVIIKSVLYEYGNERPGLMFFPGRSPEYDCSVNFRRVVFAPANVCHKVFVLLIDVLNEHITDHTGKKCRTLRARLLNLGQHPVKVADNHVNLMFTCYGNQFLKRIRLQIIISVNIENIVKTPDKIKKTIINNIKIKDKIKEMIIEKQFL